MKQIKKLGILILFLLSTCSINNHKSISREQIAEMKSDLKILKSKKAKSCLITTLAKLRIVWLKKKGIIKIPKTKIKIKNKTKNAHKSSEKAINSICRNKINLKTLTRAINSYYSLDKLLKDQMSNKHYKKIKYTPIIDIVKKHRILQKQTAIIKVLLKFSNYIISCRAMPLSLRVAVRTQQLRLMQLKGNAAGINQFSMAKKLIKNIKRHLVPIKHYKKRFSKLSKKEQAKRCIGERIFNTSFKCKGDAKFVKMLAKFYDDNLTQKYLMKRLEVLKKIKKMGVRNKNQIKA
jgi:hypothetical protein